MISTPDGQGLSWVHSREITRLGLTNCEGFLYVLEELQVKFVRDRGLPIPELPWDGQPY